MSRQATITDAAIEVLAAEGLRGLTHRAVDRAAGLPEGSTSYYFRSREALLSATVERLVERTGGEVPALVASDLDDLAARLAALIRRFITVDRERSLARYELTIEATRRPELRATLDAAAVRVRQMTARLLAEVGVAEAERAAYELTMLLDAIVFERVAGIRATERPPTVRQLSDLVRRLLAAVVEG